MRNTLYILLIIIFLTSIISGCSSPSISDWLGKATSYSQLVSYNMADRGWTVPGDPLGFSNYCYDLIQSIKEAAQAAGDKATVSAINKAGGSDRELAEAFNVGGDW